AGGGGGHGWGCFPGPPGRGPAWGRAGPASPPAAGKPRTGPRRTSRSQSGAGAEQTMAAALLLEALEPLSVEGEVPPLARGLAYDSRRVRPGEWFFALPGLHADGRRFARAAIEGGAALVVSAEASGARPEVRVRDARVGLAQASVRFFDEPSRRLLTVGITGTNGKTTTSWLIRAMLEAWGRSTGVVGTIGVFFPSGERKTGFTTPE